MSTDPPASGPRPKLTPGKRPGVIGLPSLQQARRQRSRRRGLPKGFWLWSVVIIGVMMTVRWQMIERQIEQDRQALFAKQRIIAEEQGKRWNPLRDKIQKWTSSCGKSSGDEVIDKEAFSKWDFRSLEGIYLRLPVAATETPELIRAAAQDSLHDGFTSCFVRVPNAYPMSNKACETSEDCKVGQHCGDLKRCVRYTQPFNLRLAYRTMYILSDEWVEEVQAAGTSLAMDATRNAFESAVKLAIPVAIELLDKAKYFMVVVDRPPKGDLAEKKEAGPTDPAKQQSKPAKSDTDERGISTKPHDARICVWRLSDERQILNIERRAEGQLHGATPHSEKARRARARQANSCALALSVRQALGVGAN